MEKDPGLDDPFSAFSDLDFDIDDDNEEPKLLSLQEDSEIKSTETEQADSAQSELLTTISPSAEILAIHPREREDIATMSAEEISTELTAYDMPKNSLSVIDPKIQASLLGGLRKKQDIAEYQTIGGRQIHGEIIQPGLLSIASKLSEKGIQSDLLTPGDVFKIDRFLANRPEDTDEKLHYLLDIITQSRNAVRSRRDFLDTRSPYYDPEKAQTLEDAIDKINEYLDSGGYEAHAEDEDEELATEEELNRLIEIHGNDPYFRHAPRKELIELGDIIDDRGPKVLGPLTYEDIASVTDLITPSYAPKTSARSIDVVSTYFPEVKHYFSHTKRPSDMQTAILGKYIETEIANKRTLSTQPLVCGFLALEKEFFESGFTEKVKAYLEENPNQNIADTLRMIRSRLIQGGRYCNLLMDGRDEDIQRRYKSSRTHNSAFLDEMLQKAQTWTTDDFDRRAKAQSGYIVKLDASFEEARIAYSGLKAIIEAPQKDKQGRETATQAEEDRGPKSITGQSIRRLLDVHTKTAESQFTGEADIALPNNRTEQ